MANLSVRISSPTAIWQKNAQAIVQERMQFVSQQTSVADLHRARTTSNESQSLAIRRPHTTQLSQIPYFHGDNCFTSKAAVPLSLPLHNPRVPNAKGANERAANGDSRHENDELAVMPGWLAGWHVSQR